MIIYTTNILALVFMISGGLWLPFKSSPFASLMAFLFGVLMLILSFLLEVGQPKPEIKMEPKVGRRID